MGWEIWGDYFKNPKSSPDCLWRVGFLVFEFLVAICFLVVLLLKNHKALCCLLRYASSEESFLFILEFKFSPLPRSLKLCGWDSSTGCVSWSPVRKQLIWGETCHRWDPSTAALNKGMSWHMPAVICLCKVAKWACFCCKYISPKMVSPIYLEI